MLLFCSPLTDLFLLFMPIVCVQWNKTTFHVQNNFVVCDFKLCARIENEEERLKNKYFTFCCILCVRKSYHWPSGAHAKSIEAMSTWIHQMLSPCLLGILMDIKHVFMYIVLFKFVGYKNNSSSKWHEWGSLGLWAADATRLVALFTYLFGTLENLFKLVNFRDIDPNS